MSNCRSSLLSPTRILPSMTPPISLNITTTRWWPLCVISLSWQCLHSGEWYPSSISAIPHIWASFGLLIKTVILLMLHSTPFALWTLPQWNRICEWSVIVLSTTNKRIISLSLTCKRNTTCNLYCFQNNTQVSFSNAFPLFLRYNHPTKSTSFTRVSKTIMHWYHHHITYLQLKSHMALSSSFHQHSPFVPVPYDKHPTHSDTLPFTTIEAHTYSFYSCHSLQSMVPIIHAVIQPIRWIHDTHNVQDMLHWRRWDQSKQPLFIVDSKYHDNHDGAICTYWVDGSLFISNQFD